MPRQPRLESVIGGCGIMTYRIGCLHGKAATATAAVLYFGKLNNHFDIRRLFCPQ